MLWYEMTHCQFMNDVIFIFDLLLQYRASIMYVTTVTLRNNTDSFAPSVSYC